jgi:hypothetical protein
MSTMTLDAVFEEKIILTPADLRDEITSFDSLCLDKLRATLEERCSKHGYVVKDSLKLISRSMGIVEKGRGTGDFLYYVKAQGKVYNPPEGFQLEGEVVLKNKAGLYLVIENAIKVMVPRDVHIGNADFAAVNIGDRIVVEIKAKQFHVNDPFILSVGEFVSKVGDGSPALAEDQGAEGQERSGSGAAASLGGAEGSAEGEGLGEEEEEEEVEA